MTILSDEMIEKAAKAICAAYGEESCTCRECVDMQKTGARAALSAVIDDVIEEAAKVAEKCVPNARVAFAGPLPQPTEQEIARGVATAIRSLKEKEIG